MKKLVIVLCLLAISCSSYKDIPLIVGKEKFTIQNLQTEAKYEIDNVVEGRAFTNLPENLRKSNKTDKEWDLLIDKYKAEVEYGIDEVNGKIYIRRWLTKWPNSSINNIKTPRKLYKYLKDNDFKDYKVIKEQTMDLGYTNDKAINVILLLYKGVKHEITLRPQTITVTSYLLEDKDYWESQGQFMLDTPIEVFEKYDNVNR